MLFAVERGRTGGVVGGWVPSGVRSVGVALYANGASSLDGAQFAGGELGKVLSSEEVALAMGRDVSPEPLGSGDLGARLEGGEGWLNAPQAIRHHRIRRKRILRVGKASLEAMYLTAEVSNEAVGGCACRMLPCAS